MSVGKASGQVVVTSSVLEELLQKLQALVGQMGGTWADSLGRNRVFLDAANAALVLTIATPAVSNVAQEGGIPANTNVLAMMQSAANIVRSQITVS